tara:strand:+ start:4524 stop:5567 length:1044 start_codon:yes stop_codon:yes gene_type:complete
MKIFTTGGCGFIGSNFIIDQIMNRNNIIFNYDKLTYAGNIDNLSTVNTSNNYTFYKGDICDYEVLKAKIFDFKPDFIVHFAAESHVDRSIDNPLKFVDTNIVGTVNLLDISTNYYQDFKSFCFLHVSTDEVYGSLGKSGLFTENSPYKPNSPYSASKASSDFLVRSWNKTYKLPIIITNCSNNFGPYQFPEKLIPLIIANCLDEKPLPIYGDGKNIRDWLYVNDHCDALEMVMENGQIGHSYNIGGSNEISNEDIVRKICSLLDNLKPRNNKLKYSELITFVDDRPGHDFRYAIDSSKIREEVGWRPKQKFESSLELTVKWYLENESWWKKIQKNNYNQERLGKRIS